MPVHDVRRERDEGIVIRSAAQQKPKNSSFQSDCTIAIVTHNMQEAARVSDFTAFMYLGKLVEFDATSRLLTSPRERRTQDYIQGRFG